MKKLLFAGSIILILGCSASEKTAQKPEMPKGVRWVTSSAEYIGSCKQIYTLAWDIVRESAQKETGAWAVVLDIDETVLNNVQYEVELFKKKANFSDETWAAWVERREATAIPGVKQFLDNVRALGKNAYVAFITNRDAPLEEATIDNLKMLGLWNEKDVILCRRDKSDTKVLRRQEVMRGTGRCEGQPPKNIIALFGDNLKDFYAVDGDAGLQKVLGDAHDDQRWGTQFFVLPNPTYGSWERKYK
ncbi:MAG: hypothetical protein DWQ10_02780 [Calditrichaeota bacterium]|nr:MAG: hypothetical protein DWQ10_02780 [Calditrichota bacterium]